jgi:hypothetical protein
MGNQPTNGRADVQKFKGINPEDKPAAGVLTIAKNEKNIISDVVEASNDVESTENFHQHARMTPIPPIGGPRSFISPRTELIGNVSKSKAPDDDLSTVDCLLTATNSSRKASSDPFDFRLTEGQSRRNAMADFETDCTSVTEYLFLGGHKVSELSIRSQLNTPYSIKIRSFRSHNRGILYSGMELLKSSTVRRW